MEPVDSAIRQKIMRSTLHWGKHVYPWFKPYKHIIETDYHVNKILFDEDPRAPKRVLVSWPPRHSKSTYSSILLPTRYLGCRPHHHVVIAGYGKDLTTKFSAQSKDIFEQHGEPVFGYRVSKSTRAKDDWALEESGGTFRAVGVGSALLGTGAHLAIIDDPYKDWMEANSPRTRQTVQDWYQAVLETRLEPGAKVFIVHQRWHIEDLTGWLLSLQEATGEKWVHLNFPAIATQDEYDRNGVCWRKEGEALCPARYPIERLESLRRIQGEHKFNAMYQGRPGTAEGQFWKEEYFDDHIWVDEWPGKMDQLVMSIDPAHGSELEAGCDAAIVALGTNRDSLLTVDSDLSQTGPSETVSRAVQFVKRLPRPPDAVSVEGVGLQSMIAEDLQKALRKESIYSPVFLLGTDGNMKKADRIQMLDPFITYRDFRFLRTPGNAKLIHQLRYFPSSEVKQDGPDCLEMCTRLLAEKD